MISNFVTDLRVSGRKHLLTFAVFQGHTGDLRAVQKIEQSFLGADIITASTDGVICKLNSETREPVWKLCMKGYPFLCVDINKEGELLVLGTKDGQ